MLLALIGAGILLWERHHSATEPVMFQNLTSDLTCPLLPHDTGTGCDIDEFPAHRCGIDQCHPT
ncbi:hypothetical protein [Nocardia noduli]|uniref:hypothetical protein n=1 Tax=Nocardia noduli TaxID=2815722 RepID=UPI001C247A9D|nr:hypothetical protein [Nocardia noduli]